MDRGARPRITQGAANAAFELQGEFERWRGSQKTSDPIRDRIGQRIDLLVQQTDYADGALRVAQSAVIGNGPNGQRFDRNLAEFRRSGLRLVAANDDDEAA